MFWDLWDLQRVMKAPNVSTWNWRETQLAWFILSCQHNFYRVQRELMAHAKMERGEGSGLDTANELQSLHDIMTSCRITHGK